jgi:hypothetical protein
LQYEVLKKVSRVNKFLLRTKIYLTIAALLALTGILYAANGVPFATVPQPISVVASPTQLVVSEFCTEDLVKISDTGIVSPFATIPGPNVGCKEKYMGYLSNLGGVVAWTRRLRHTNRPDL